jgi:hypothetical protein
LLQEGDAQVTFEHFGSEGLPKPRVSGVAPSGTVLLGQVALAQSTFLLEPGGQDYVGNNSYDDTSRSMLE